MILSSRLRSMGQEFGSGSAEWLLCGQLESLGVWLASGLVWRTQKGFIHAGHFGDGDLKAALSWLTLPLHASSWASSHTVFPVAVFVVLVGSLDFKSECSMKREVEAAKPLQILRLMQHPCKRGNMGGPRCYLMMEAMPKYEWSP